VLAVIDFETHSVTDDVAWAPPEPTGLAIRLPGRQERYLRWNHPNGNNTTRKAVAALLKHLWESDFELLFHNAKFDLAVARAHFGLEVPHWSRIHDTMFLAYLYNPHAFQLGLKELARDLLGMEPEERDTVSDWLWTYRAKVYEKTGRRLSRTKGRVGRAGEFYWLVPGDVLEPYACGDVRRTEALFNALAPEIKLQGMWGAYNRERQLLPILMENERLGICVDVPALENDIPAYQDAFIVAEKWLRDRLDAPGLNFDADRDVGAALQRAGVLCGELKHGKLGYLSVSKENLTAANFSDADVFLALGYRNRLKTCMEMFMLPWLAQAKRRGDGRISTNWNQTRGGDGGTRTGRPSTTNPNLLNISKDFEGRPDGYTHPEFLGVPKLPLVRKYVTADEGHVFVDFDFNGQELRVFAHFESGKLYRAYHENPKIDVHQMVADDIKRISPTTKLDRMKTKIINFRSIYGSGVRGVAQSLNCDYETAKEFKRVHSQALPGLAVLNNEIKRMVALGEPIVTWGRRRYFPEEPKMDEETGEKRTFEYKLINYLIQGSAADLTKQAIIDWYNHPNRDPRTRLLVTVYDEIAISCPPDVLDEQSALLKEVMEWDRLDVPMLADGASGANWAEAK
jgi:DNA polymerase I-like protein with 3'-5' exonuclease and polymerase domains